MPKRKIQFAAVINAETPEDAAKELEDMLAMLRGGELTEGLGGGGKVNFAWCALDAQNTALSGPPGR